ncbi:MAG: hypothetical protein BWY63_02458 [Chloroflexi bacterium ADurb.Bin360]|nr:MAG: hypothetical protein BWY63_02458 [Chloroflexi bacterium ADurb.Bin360]
MVHRSPTERSPPHDHHTRKQRAFVFLASVGLAPPGWTHRFRRTLSIGAVQRPERCRSLAIGARLVQPTDGRLGRAIDGSFAIRHLVRARGKNVRAAYTTGSADHIIAHPCAAPDALVQLVSLCDLRQFTGLQPLFWRLHYRRTGDSDAHHHLARLAPALRLCGSDAVVGAPVSSRATLCLGDAAHVPDERSQQTFRAAAASAARTADRIQCPRLELEVRSILVGWTRSVAHVGCARCMATELAERRLARRAAAIAGADLLSCITEGFSLHAQIP